MRGAVDRHQARAGNRSRECRGSGGRRRFILRADQHQRGDAKRRGARAQVAAREGFRRAGIALGRGAAQHRAQALGGGIVLERGGDPARQHRRHQRFHALAAHDARPLMPRIRRQTLHGGVAKDQGSDPFRRQCREGLGDRPADRQPAHRRRPDAARIEHRQRVARQHFQRVGAGRHAGEAVAAQVRANHPPASRQHRRRAVPDMQVGAERMQHQQRRRALRPVLLHMHHQSARPHEHAPPSLACRAMLAA